MSNIILIASDHNGVKEKRELKNFLKKNNYTVIDLGPYDETISVDYIDYASQLAQIISQKEVERGILICGTGVGMSIVANRFTNVRSVLAHNEMTAVKSREHNNSNVICLGAWISSIEEMQYMSMKWLDEKWGEGRHVKRVERIDSKGGLVLVNGVFDLLHEGHLELIKFAKTQGEKLVVAIDADERVRQNKGKDRPVNNENIRKKLLESNKFVDEVVIFNSKEQLKELYNTLSPNVIVKGSEWTEEQIRRQDEIPREIDIKVYPLYGNHSTTNLLKKIDSMVTVEKK